MFENNFSPDGPVTKKLRKWRRNQRAASAQRHRGEADAAPEFVEDPEHPPGYPELAHGR
jgi:hypothetical protein